MRINPIVVFRKEFDNTGLLFNPADGEVFGLNATSVFIWECLTNNMSETEILNEINQKMSNLPLNIADELQEFIIQLQKKGFLAD